MAIEPARRQRSHSGKTSVKLTKYYSSGASKVSQRSPFNKRSLSRGWRQRWPGWLLDLAVVVILAAVLIYSLALKPPPTVTVTNTSYHQSEIYRQYAAQQFKSLKNKNKVTLDESGIAEKLKTRFPEIDNVWLELPLLGQTPKITIEVSKPIIFLGSRGSLYIIDAKGRAVAEAADLPQIRDLSVVDDQSGFNIVVGQQVLSASEVRFIEFVSLQTKKAGVPVSLLSLPPKAQELDLRASDKPYLVKFYLGGDPELQVGQFLAFRNQFEKGGTQPSEYLDVRVQGKVFYR